MTTAWPWFPSTSITQTQPNSSDALVCMCRGLGQLAFWGVWWSLMQGISSLEWWPSTLALVVVVISHYFYGDTLWNRREKVVIRTISLAQFPHVGFMTKGVWIIEVALRMHTHTHTHTHTYIHTHMHTLTHKLFLSSQVLFCECPHWDKEENCRLCRHEWHNVKDQVIDLWPILSHGHIKLRMALICELFDLIECYHLFDQSIQVSLHNLCSLVM